MRWFGLLLAGVFVFVVALMCGVAKISPRHLVPIIAWEVKGLAFPSQHAQAIRLAQADPQAFYQSHGFYYKEAVIIWHVRMPRILLAALVGAALALGGATLQSLFQNPLADPSIVGVSAGASVGALLMLFLFSGAVEMRLWVAFGAFVGAVAAVLVIFGCARLCRRNLQPMGLLLMGVAVSAMASSLVGILLVQAHSHVFRDFFFWSFGSLSAVGWAECFFVLPWVVVPAIWVFAQANKLNALLLGKEEAFYLGISVGRFSFLVFVAVALMVGSTVAVCGVIGFVGIMAPHLARLLFGGDNRLVLPCGAFMGGLLVMGSDAWIRIGELRAEWPLGAMTALIGVPFFLLLLVRGQWAPVEGASPS